MKRYRVTQEAVVYVYASDRHAAVNESARTLMGPRWQHRWPLRLLPWPRLRVRAVSGFVLDELVDDLVRVRDREDED